MNACRRSISLVMMLGMLGVCSTLLGGVAAASDHRANEQRWPAGWCCRNRLLTGCPDDYCRKPMPRVMCLPCGEPDDYCAKLPPRVTCLRGGECDNYCRKPLPEVCRPLRPDRYNCGQK